MASTQDAAAAPPPQAGQDDVSEPLLGRPGDVSQPENSNLLANLYQGTAVLAQFGIVLLLLFVWAALFLQPVILFTFHPLLVTLSLFSLVQAVLVLQPTHTAAQKQAGQRVHAGLAGAAFLLAAGGIAVIEYNKFSSGRDHFHAVHGYFGVAAGVVLVLQVLFGITMWAVPVVWGGEARGKALWKYHRMSGYALLLLLLVTVVTAARTDYNEGVLHMPAWPLFVLSALVVVGVFPRIKKQKMGF